MFFFFVLLATSVVIHRKSNSIDGELMHLNFEQGMRKVHISKRLFIIGTIFCIRHMVILAFVFIQKCSMVALSLRRMILSQSWKFLCGKLCFA